MRNCNDDNRVFRILAVWCRLMDGAYSNSSFYSNFYKAVLYVSYFLQIYGVSRILASTFLTKKEVNKVSPNPEPSTEKKESEDAKQEPEESKSKTPSETKKEK